MEKKKKAYSEVGWICMSNREKIRTDRRGGSCTSYLSGRRISGVGVGRLELDKRKLGDAQQAGEPQDRGADRARYCTTAQDRAGSRLEEKECVKNYIYAMAKWSCVKKQDAI